jgi:hypothetical protein
VNTNVKCWTNRIVGTFVLATALIAGLGAASASAQPAAAPSIPVRTVARHVPHRTALAREPASDKWIMVEIFPLMAYGRAAQTACQTTASLFTAQGFLTNCVRGTLGGVYEWALLVYFPD